MSAFRTLETLETRIAKIPEYLRAVSIDEAPLDDADGPVLVTGGGLSEGPSRFLVALLEERGVRAAFVPLSEFIAPRVHGAGGTLVIFSQGFAPNARLPLAHIDQFRRAIIVTALPGESPLASEASSRGARVITLPPSEEAGLLLRVVGPPVQAVAALRLARPDFDTSSLPEAFARAFADEAARMEEPNDLLNDGHLTPIAFVAAGRYGTACFGLRWKLLEGLHVSDPPVWDLLQFAHGPFQALCDRRATLVLLTREDAPHEALLYGRLQKLLVPARHRCVTLHSSLPGLLAWFEHDARLDARLLATLRRHPIDLVNWPGRGHDGPIYDLKSA